MALSIEEQKRRLNAKYADDYALAREVASITRVERLLAKLAETEEKLPPLYGWTEEYSWYEEIFRSDWCVEWVYLEDGPPLDEIDRRDFTEKTWTDENGRVWYPDDYDRWGTPLNLVTVRRAIRDELADRLSREFLQDQVGYDS